MAASRAAFRGFPVYFTGHSMDHSIHGAGYFVVSVDDTDQRLYTRDGRFWIDENSQICLGNRFPKYRLEPICSVPMGPGELIIKPDGTLEWKDEHAAAWGPQTIGQLELAHFTSTKALQEVAPGYFTTEDQPWLTNPGDQGAGVITTCWREMGRESDDLYAILFMPSLLLSFIAGIVIASVCRTAIANDRKREFRRQESLAGAR
jgi:flagellar basal body rod protein FlgG